MCSAPLLILSILLILLGITERTGAPVIIGLLLLSIFLGAF